MSSAVVLGGAACLEADLAALGDFGDIRIGVNHHAYLTRDIDAVATLHPEHIGGWRQDRRAAGFPAVPFYSFKGRDANKIWRPESRDDTTTWTRGSSGLYAAGVARFALGADIVVLAGCPLDQTPNPISGFANYRKFHTGLNKVAPLAGGWLFSMSGPTSEKLGTPP